MVHSEMYKGKTHPNINGDIMLQLLVQSNHECNLTFYKIFIRVLGYIPAVE